MELKKILFILIVILFLATRLYKITEVPMSLYWDEASILYNGYLVVHTGLDEWGEYLPLEFKAFGEYKLPIFVYTVGLFTVLLGLSELAVRLPSATFSLISLLLIYKICKELFQKESVGLWGMFFFTISPWIFIFSRTGYESTSGVMFYLLGIWMFLKARVNHYVLPISIFTFGLTLYSYNSFRVVTPLTILILMIYLVRSIKKVSTKSRPFILSSLLIISLLTVPLAYSWQKGSLNARIDEVGIFKTGKTKPQLVKEFSGNYISHLSPQFLFKGDINIRSQQNGFGEIYHLDLLLIILGLIILFKKSRPIFYLLLSLFLAAFIPAAITKESPHALRSISVVPALSILLATGASYLSKNRFIVLGLVAIYTSLFGNYFWNYINNYPIDSADQWQYANKKIFVEYKDKLGQYDNVLISDRYNQPYIYALVYGGYNLKDAEYNQNIRSKTSLVKRIGNITLNNIDYYQLPRGKSLIFSHPTDKMDELKPVAVLNFPNDKPMWYVYEYKK